MKRIKAYNKPRLRVERFVIKKWRLHLVQFILLTIALAVVVRLVQFQIVEREKYQELARNQYLQMKPLKAQRGIIYDRNGKELALNKPTYDLGVDVRHTKIKEIAPPLSRVLHKSQNELIKILNEATNFIYLERHLDVEVGEKIKAMNLKGVVLHENNTRIYPLKEKLAPVLGFVNVDGQGLSGLELTFDPYLRGEDGKMLIQLDAGGDPIMTIESATRYPRQGDDLILTVDHVLQTIVEEELAAAVQKYKARAGNAIITDPSTGEILAMASVPGFDANNPRAYPPENWRIRPITDVFEPGSTFKIVTMMAALSNRIKKVHDIIFCENGKAKFFGQLINDPEKYGWLSFEDVFAHSSNIGTAKIAQEVGASELYQAIREFGFGSKTGIELPGEASGILNRPTDWSKLSLISIAIGHEVAVTALQVAMAYGAIANGGYLMKPFVVKEIRDREGKIVQQYYPQRIRRVMDREVANTMAKILERVVDKGTGRLAKIPGYRIAGKTGTAQKPLKDRPGYSNSKFIASFCGFFPVDQPRFLIFVMIDEPHPAHSGGHVAAPTFKKILERILKIYEIPPQQYTSVEETGFDEKDKYYVPNLVGRRYDVAVQILDELGLNYQLEGEGLLVMKQEFHSDSETPQVVLTMARKMDDEEKVTVPDVRGLSVRKAVSILSFRGLRVHLNGSGRVVKQSLDPGLQVRPGTHIWIACESTGELPVEIRVTN